MGTITKGILGGFSGTVGTVIGGSWKGIEYMRSKPARRTATSSQKQKEQQEKFSVMIKFLSTLNSLLMFSFKSYAVRMTGANSALSYNLRNAITGTYPAYDVNYSLALVSRGDLPNAQSPAAVAAAGGVINYTWVNNAGTGKAADDDKAILVVYCKAKQASNYVTSGDRVDEAGTLDVSAFTGEVVETWIGFFSADGRETATSIYTGQLTVI